MAIEDIKLREIELFLELIKLKSVRELGRQQNMQPGQVSKWIAALERKIGHTLIERSASGVRLSAKGMELIPILEKMRNLQDELSGEDTKSDSDMFTFASSSFLSTHLIPLIIKDFKDDSKLRLIDLPPTNFVSAALRGAFDYCLHSKKLDWPQTWTTKEVGILKWNIYARKKHPVLKSPGKKAILKYPFVTPIYWNPEGTQYGDDQCPIPMSERIKGHETATAASAAEIVKVSNHLAFLPEILALKSESTLEVVPYSGKKVLQPIYLTVRNTKVKQRDFEKISEICKNILLSL